MSSAGDFALGTFGTLGTLGSLGTFSLLLPNVVVSLGLLDFLGFVKKGIFLFAFS